MAKHSKSEGNVIPTWSPPFAPGPYFMEKYESSIIELDVPKAEIEYMTAAPLKPVKNSRVFVVIVDGAQPPHSLHYHEAVICHEVEFDGKRGLHIPYIWVSTDTALLVGREIYGMPKLMCDDDRLEINGNEVTGRLARNGKLMMEAAVTIDQKAAAEELPPFHSWMLVRHVPSPDPEFPARRQVIHAVTSDFKLDFAWKGRGWAKMLYPGTSGIDRIPTDKVVNAWYANFTFVLSVGKVLEDKEYFFQPWK